MSDPEKRKEHDRQRKHSKLFNPLSPSASSDSNANYVPKSDPDSVFNDVFEDLLRPEVEIADSSFYSTIGAVR